MTDKIDRSGPVKVMDGGGWWVTEAKRVERKIPDPAIFGPDAVAKAEAQTKADRDFVASLCGWK